jgi:molecular chaperone GrpE
MTDQKTTNDEAAQDANAPDVQAQDANAETGAQDPAGSDKTAIDGAMDDTLNDVLAAAGAETKGDADVQDPLTALTAERDQLKDQLLRALADMENMRRRSEREAANVRKYGHTPFARDLVGAIDNLARVVESAPENLDQADETVKSLITGIQLSWTELQSVIEKHGINALSRLARNLTIICIRQCLKCQPMTSQAAWFLRLSSMAMFFMTGCCVRPWLGFQKQVMRLVQPAMTNQKPTNRYEIRPRINA